MGGKAHELVIEPTVLRDMRNDMPAAWNEVFGPVAPVIPFGSDEEAVTLANATRYGLAASVYSKDLGHAHHVAIELEAGMVHINDQTIQDEHHVPFGGVKGSGIGRYNGEAIIQEMTELQWFLVEQVEEERTARELVAKFVLTIERWSNQRRTSCLNEGDGCRLGEPDWIIDSNTPEDGRLQETRIINDLWAVSKRSSRKTDLTFLGIFLQTSRFDFQFMVRNAMVPSPFFPLYIIGPRVGLSPERWPYVCVK